MAVSDWFPGVAHGRTCRAGMRGRRGGPVVLVVVVLVVVVLCPLLRFLRWQN